MGADARGDATQAARLLRSIRKHKPAALCADRAYDSNEIRALMVKIGARPAIPSKKERFFRRLKDWRKLALMTDKTRAAFLSLSLSWVWLAELWFLRKLE